MGTTKMNNGPLLTPLPSRDVLNGVKYALILPHTMPDGDTIGSSVALFLGLTHIGIQSWIILDDDIPRDLAFMAGPLVTTSQYLCRRQALEVPMTSDNTVVITVDLSDLERLASRKNLLESYRVWNLDHHVTNLMFGDLRVIDSEASSTGELMHRLLKHWEIPISKAMAEALYVAITTDTGSFKYANTTPTTHRVVADLLEIGIDRDKIALNLYHSEPSSKLKLHSLSLGHLKIYSNGRVARAYVSQHMLMEAGAHMTEADGLVERIRDIEGIDTVILLKEVGPDEVKISMRSIGSINVSRVALSFGGGGHRNAAGFTLRLGLEAAIEKIDALVDSDQSPFDGEVGGYRA